MKTGTAQSHWYTHLLLCTTTTVVFNICSKASATDLWIQNCFISFLFFFFSFIWAKNTLHSFTHRRLSKETLPWCNSSTWTPWTSLVHPPSCSATPWITRIPKLLGWSPLELLFRLPLLVWSGHPRLVGCLVPVKPRWSSQHPVCVSFVKHVVAFLLNTQKMHPSFLRKVLAYKFLMVLILKKALTLMNNEPRKAKVTYITEEKTRDDLQTCK